jgi:hypothetical protein
VIQLIAKATFPLFETVTDPLALDPRFTPPKARLVGFSPIIGSNPVPLNPTVCVDPATFPVLSVTVKLAVRTPVPAGAKLTLNVQLAPTPKLAPHPFANPNSALFAPLIAMDPRVNGPVPLFVTVTAWLPLVDPTF